MASGYKGSVTVGIDIGTNDSIIAYVGKAMVDIVQNEVSQRKTPTVVGFNDRQRLLGDAASTVIKSNLKNTVRNFRHIVGQMSQVEEQLKHEKFWSLARQSECADGNVGFTVNYKGEEVTYSATQIMAMYLTKMRETAEMWCQAKVSDVVLSVPSYFSDFQRQAMIDAADIAGLNCLRLMNEHTATALAYGIYRTKEFSAEKPTITAFGHMGHSSFSISIVQFWPSNLSIMAEKSCKTCAGRDMDKALTMHFAKEFEKKYNVDPLENKKGMLKLEDACSKTKKVLSANEQAPIGVECLYEDFDLSSKISRDTFEELCAPLRKQCEETIMACIEEAMQNGLQSLEEINFVEILGGASRVPWFAQIMQDKFGKELSRTLNADECVARGCALQAAILSPAYKVRDFKVEDRVPHPVTITWMGTNKDVQEGDGDTAITEDAVAPKEQALQLKNMEVFKETDKMDQRRYITWYRNAPFELGAQYSKTGTKLGDYNIMLDNFEQKKKIKIEAKMNLHGIFKLEAAHIVEVEEYEEIVKEKREIVDADGDTPMPDATTEEKKEEGLKEAGDAAAAKAEKKPKYEWVDVKKPKTRTKRTALEVTSSATPGIPKDLIAHYKDVESKIISDAIAIKENDDRRNELEAYIYSMREKVCSDSGVCSAYIKKEDKEAFNSLLVKGEDWLYDHFDATTLELCDKLQELQGVGSPVMKRFQDRGDAKEYSARFLAVLSDIRALANNPSEEYYHIDVEKRQNLATATTELEKWVNDALKAAEEVPLHEEAPLKTKDIKKREKEIREAAQTVMSEPKPQKAPETEKPQEGEHNAASATEETATTGEKKGSDESVPLAEDAPMDDADKEAGVEKKEEGGAAADSMLVD